MAYTIAIVGRPNVGKSTIFNRIINDRRAIMDDASGVTRDRLYAKATYLDKSFQIIDTGGITLEDGDFNQEIKMQALIAIDEADCILFVVDATTGITKEDEIINNILRKKQKPIIVVVNKVDNKNLLQESYEFYQLGHEHVVCVSGVNGSGIYDVLDLVYPHITNETNKNDDVIRFSLIGRPNVGKSTLFNSIINNNRSIVSNINGTTRDSIDYQFSYEGQNYEIVDTAGINKRGKVYEKVDKYSVLRSIKSVCDSDICLWLIDANQGLIEQDKHVVSYAINEYKPVIIIVNKWDLINKEQQPQHQFQKELLAKIPFLSDSKVLFVSALDKKGINKILPTINEIYQKYNQEFKTSIINNVLNDLVSAKLHPSHKGKPIRFYYATQIANKPPTFLIFVNNKNLVHFSYQRYLENGFKKMLDLNGIKIKLIFKNRVKEEA